MKKFATISGDIISYTSLSDKDRTKLAKSIKSLLSDLKDRYRTIGFYGRLVQGDHVECVMEEPGLSLRICLILKAYVKSINLDEKENSRSDLKHFKEHGIRLAIAVGSLSKLDLKNDIIDGEAIYLSGRTIEKYSTSNKKKIVIKQTLFFRSPNNELQEEFDSLIALIDTLIAKCSAKQCEVVYYKLLDFNEKEIASTLGRNQSTISQHSTAAGWYSIEKALMYFERRIL